MRPRDRIREGRESRRDVARELEDKARHDRAMLDAAAEQRYVDALLAHDVNLEPFELDWPRVRSDS